MLIPNHPDDERLSALAARDDDALADATLASHVSTCIRCTDLVTELGALRASLSELPDIAPHRPLQLLPPVADTPAAVGGGAAGWIRRLFAPALTAGAAIAMVGLIGTAGPQITDEIFADVGTELGAPGGDAGEPFAEQLRSAATEDNGGEGAAPAAAASDGAEADGQGLEGFAAESPEGGRESGRDLPAERSIWPMVLFTGIALMAGVALLRWILVPRAG